MQFSGGEIEFYLPDPLPGIQRTRADKFPGLIGEHMSKYTGPIEPILLSVTQVARMIGFGDLGLFRRTGKRFARASLSQATLPDMGNGVTMAANSQPPSGL